MYATVDEPQEYLIHDVRFHRAIAEAAGNPILGVLMETVATAIYDERRKTVQQAVDLRQSAEMHRAIYRAVRARNAVAARKTMEEHLHRAESERENELAGRPKNKMRQQRKSADGIQFGKESNAL
jgi:GntR family transcriptional repressor for pyruvate dehydrogenase complex